MSHPILTIFNNSPLSSIPLLACKLDLYSRASPACSSPLAPICLFLFSLYHTHSLSWIETFSLPCVVLGMCLSFYGKHFPWPLCICLMFWPPLERLPNLSCVESDAFTSSILALSKLSCDHTSYCIFPNHTFKYMELWRNGSQACPTDILFSA